MKPASTLPKVFSIIFFTIVIVFDFYTVHFEPFKELTVDHIKWYVLIIAFTSSLVSSFCVFALTKDTALAKEKPYTHAALLCLLSLMLCMLGASFFSSRWNMLWALGTSMALTTYYALLYRYITEQQEKEFLFEETY